MKKLAVHGFPGHRTHITTVKIISPKHRWAFARGTQFCDLGGCRTNRMALCDKLFVSTKAWVPNSERHLMKDSVPENLQTFECYCGCLILKIFGSKLGSTHPSSSEAGFHTSRKPSGQSKWTPASASWLPLAPSRFEMWHDALRIRQRPMLGGQTNSTQLHGLKRESPTDWS